jgi:C-terminal processing protease CtpA/Prc
MTTHRSHALFVLLLIALLFLPDSARSQSGATPVIDRGRGKEMLQNIKRALKDTYYDPNFRGMNVETRFRQAEEQIDKATSTGQILAIIAQALVELDDSHTSFLPPELVVEPDFGFKLQMIGDTCYVTSVKAGGDAETKGLKAGYVIYAIEGFEPTRDSLWKIIYSYFVLLPQPTLKLTIREPKGTLKEFLVNSAISKNKIRHIEAIINSDVHPSYYDLAPDTIVCRLPEFNLSDGDVDDMMKRIKVSQNLILDLRGNPGGLVSMEQRLIGSFFDHDVKIGDEKERKKTSERTAKTRGPNKIFPGKVFVLIDSNSSSAAEVFARIMQLEKRGVVIGDRSAGKVMTSVQTGFVFNTAAASSSQFTRAAFYGANITIADLIMSDGKSLEKTGVTPDLLLLPTAEDMANGRDPILAKAATLAGATIDAEKAGTIHKEIYKAEKKAEEKANDKN